MLGSVASGNSARKAYTPVFDVQPACGFANGAASGFERCNLARRHEAIVLLVGEFQLSLDENQLEHDDHLPDRILMN